MRFVPTRIHGMLDYLGGIVLIAAPWLFGFSDVPAATWIMTGAGVLALVQSLMTDYELGLARVVAMPVHLAMDGLLGAVLLVSPWLFGFADAVWLPFVVFGLLEIGASLTTRTVPDDVRDPAAVTAGRGRAPR